MHLQSSGKQLSLRGGKREGANKQQGNNRDRIAQKNADHAVTQTAPIHYLHPQTKNLRNRTNQQQTFLLNHL
jgi:hypothetical protein